MEGTEQIYKNFEICVKLLQHSDMSIVERASQNLIGFVQLSTMQKFKEATELCFVEEHFSYLIKALKTEKISIVKRILKCIFWALN